MYRDFQFAAKLEPLHHWLEIGFGEILRERLADRRANQLAGDIFSAAELAFIFELEFSGHRGDGAVNIGDARDGTGIVAANGALLGAAEDIFERADGQPLANARAAIHPFVFTRLKSHFLYNLADVLRDFDAALAVTVGPGFLRGDGHALGDGRGIMRAN